MQQPQLVGTDLRVRDAARMVAFYRDVIGLGVTEVSGPTTTLGTRRAPDLLRLVEDPSATVPSEPVVGLYHHALLVPDRRALGRVVAHLAAHEVSFQGFSDHGVSEAAYLADPERNGIEIYRDRASERWPRSGASIAMVTRPLDARRLVAEADGAGPIDAAAALGHVHLHVASLEEAARFYRDAMGLTVTQRNYPGALFLAAGEYHHHVGLNEWAGDRRAPSGATGLIGIRWRGDPEQLVARFEEAGIDAARERGELVATDPTGARVVIAP